MTDAAVIAHLSKKTTPELRALAAIAQNAVRTAIATCAGKSRIAEATRNRNAIERLLVARLRDRMLDDGRLGRAMAMAGEVKSRVEVDGEDDHELDFDFDEGTGTNGGEDDAPRADGDDGDED